jgi:glycosyl transferase-like sugar-binding protein
MALLIPRLFHWIRLGGDAMPDEHHHWREGWLRAHPGWDHRLWTDHNLPPLKNFPEFCRAETFAQKADIARYELVERYGGIYLDTDMECIDNLEPLLDGVEAFAGWLEPDVEIGIGIFGATPGHPWLMELVSQLPTSMRSGFDILWQTGPRFFTRVTRNREDIAIFEKQRLYGNVDSSHCGPEHRSYAIHHATKSWAAHQREATEATLRQIAEELDSRIPMGHAFICVDDAIGLGRFSHRPSVSFLERGGHYVGKPPDDATAIAELQRMQREGARFIAFIGPARWWLDYYTGLQEHLRSSAIFVTQSEHLTLFALR